MQSISLTKRYRCAQCREVFKKALLKQIVCGHVCAALYAVNQGKKIAAKKTAAERKETKLRLDSIKTRAQLLKEAEKAFNAYVRQRDVDNGCISCDKPAEWQGQWHASHYKSVGSNSFLRYHLWNVHKACSVCNNHKSGNIIDYTPRLIEKIGQVKFNFVSNAPKEKKYELNYLIRLKRVFVNKLKRLKKCSNSILII